jgi:hypothetical protein
MIRKAFVVSNASGANIRVEKLNDYYVRLSINSEEIVLNHTEWNELNQLHYDIYLSSEDSDDAS